MSLATEFEKKSKRTRKLEFLGEMNLVVPWHKNLLLRHGIVVDATLIAAPSSTNNASGERDPELHQSKKGNQWHFGMKCHIGVDSNSRLIHTIVSTSCNKAHVSHSHMLSLGQESHALGAAATEAWTIAPKRKAAP
ncbi:DDE family transposase [Comamonas sp. JUb58]|nr:DDE family transposase [Comamonas sp. JUb58]